MAQGQLDQGGIPRPLARPDRPRTPLLGLPPPLPPPSPPKRAPPARPGMTAAEISTGEREHEKFCRDLAARTGGIHSLGSYTPYSSKEFRLIFPGQQGGPNYGGVSIDPALGYVFVNSRNVAGMGRFSRSADGDQGAYRRVIPLGGGSLNAPLLDPTKQPARQHRPRAGTIACDAQTGH